MSSGLVRTPVEPDYATARAFTAVAPLTFSVDEEGEASLGGVKLLDIVEKFGTALYVYDEEHLHLNLRTYRQEFLKRYPTSDIIYAAKSFCCLAMDKIVLEEDCCIDVASGGELAMALRAGIPGNRIVVQGNNKTRLEIEEAVDAGAKFFVVDTLEEIARINEIAGDKGIKQPIVLRVCPGIEADTHAYIQTANEDSKFGFNITCGAARAATVFALALESVQLLGYHCHIGSQIFALNSFTEAIDVVFNFMQAIREELKFTAKVLDVGGGLGVAYLKDDQPSTIAQFAEVTSSAVIANCQRLDYPLPHLFTEPGRSISANPGISLYTVGSVKKIPGVATYVAVDGGMTDNIRCAMYGSEYEAFVVEAAGAPRTEVVDIVGKHCESGDIVVYNRPLQRCGADDHICVLATGAYAYEMASNYNKQVRAGVVFVRDGQAREVVRRETYEDLMAREVL